jgi:hypothetical protein
MSPSVPLVSQLPDRELVDVVSNLAAAERRATAALVEALAELDARRLYLEEGYSSLFTFCTERLRLSESSAYHRITTARAVRRFPVLLDRLRGGELTMTAIALLAPHLSEENCRQLAEAARHRSKRAIEELVAALRPRPDAPSSVRKLPAPRAAAAEVSAPARSESPSASSEAREAEGVAGLLLEPAAVACGSALPAPRPAVVRPLSPKRYQIQVTVSAETHDKLRRAQELLRHAIRRRSGCGHRPGADGPRGTPRADEVGRHQAARRGARDTQLAEERLGGPADLFERKRGGRVAHEQRRTCAPPPFTEDSERGEAGGMDAGRRPVHIHRACRPVR